MHVASDLCIGVEAHRVVPCRVGQFIVRAINTVSEIRYIQTDIKFCIGLIFSWHNIFLRVRSCHALERLVGFILRKQKKNVSQKVYQVLIRTYDEGSNQSFPTIFFRFDKNNSIQTLICEQVKLVIASHHIERFMLVMEPAIEIVSLD